MTRIAASRVARLFVAACLAAPAGTPAAATPPHAATRAAAQDASGAPDASAPPQPAATVRDPDFGVAARHFGLQRRVEMFQWRARGDGGYDRAWSDAALDSSGYAPGHENPPFPLRSRQWVAKEVRVDGLPLDPAVLSALGTWAPFRPSFSALPGNLSATFQPQGDGLGTAENPMAPQVGDLRIHWRELRLPPLAGRIVPDAGRWKLRGAVSAAGAPAGVEGRDAAGQAPERRRPGIGWIAAFLLLCVAGIAAGRGLRNRR
ncbi:MAG: TMEM43 family protein [Luteimonas sp.]